MPASGFETEDDDREIARVKRELRSRGWLLRYTEWPSGHQVVLHRREETAIHLVTRWCRTELEAWLEALAIVELGVWSRDAAASDREHLHPAP
jgi:hypothetical protein